MKYVALVFTLFCASPLAAAETRLTFGEAVGAPGDTVAVPISLSNTQAISGIGFSLEYDPSAVSFLRIDQTDLSMTPYVRENAPHLHFVFLDPQAAQVLATGNHELGKLMFTTKENAPLGKYPLGIGNLDFADGKRPPKRVQGVAESAGIWITTNWIRPSTAEWLSATKVEVDLHISTDEPVSAIQFALKWHASALAFDSTSTTTSWRIFSHEPEDRTVRIVAADFMGDRAFKDENAPLVSVHFRYRPNQNAPQMLLLELDEVLTTDGSGEKVPVIGRDGEIDTALRPERPAISFDKLHIEEIHADPASSDQGDANGDGVRHSREDEFIELINRGDQPIDLSGYLLSDDDVALDKMFEFPEGTTIAPGERIVLFGGGSPSGIPGQVYTDDGSIGNGLTNAGDVIVLIDPTAGDTVLTVAFESTATDQSLVQQDGAWVGHSTLYSGIFSPGEASQPIDTSDNGEGDQSTDTGGESTDGSTGDPPTDTGDPLTDEQINRNIQGLHIDEIHADPASSEQGDANGDGVRHSREDEFIELINRGDQSIDLSGYLLSDDDVALDKMFEFPEGTTIAPGERIVLFGGGSPQGIPGQVYTDDGSIGNGLTNSGDVIVLINPATGDTLLAVAYQSKANDQSLVQQDGAWVGHSTLYTGRFSPGEASQPINTSDNGEGDLPTDAGDGKNTLGLHIEEIHADPAFGERGDANGDGIRHGQEDEFIELINRGDQSIDLSGYLLSDDDVALDKMFRFPDSTIIAPGERIVLFGGGSPSGIPGQVYTDDGNIGNGLINAGDVLVLIDPTARDTLLAIAYQSNAKDQSLVQQDETWIGHSTLYAGRFSPGEASQPIDTSDNGEGDQSDENTDENPDGESTDTSGESTDGNVGDPPTDEKTNRNIQGLHIDEIHADPASSEQGDANGDGMRHSREDEFIELINRGDQPIDISGYLLSDDDVALDKMFEFPEGTTIAPGERIVLFGGGSPSGIPGQVYTDDGSIGNGLTNSGDVLVLINLATGDTLLVVAYQSKATDQSLVLKDGTWIGHSTLYTGRFSPGEASQPIDTSDNGEGDPPTDGEGDRSDENTDENPDGESTDTDGESKDGSAGDQPTNESENVVSVPDSTASMPDSVASEPREPANSPPRFLSISDTLALVGLTFQYAPRVHDPDGDALDLRVHQPLAWLHWDGEHLSGLATERDTGRVQVVIWASDGRDSVSHRVSVRVLSLRAQLDAIAPIYQSMTWRHQIDVPPNVQVQVDGGPEWHDHSLVWKPQSVGTHPAIVALSTDRGDELFLPVSIFVWPKPALKLHSVLVEPQRDINGDGRVDALEDQYVTIENFGDMPIDISGWLLGDDDGALTRLPAGTVLAADDRLILVGNIQAVAAERVFSAGGRIGNGLAKSDRILLIAPAGPDTLIDLRYTGSTPGQPIVFQDEQTVDTPPPDDPESREGEADDPIQPDRKRVIYPSPNPFNSATRFGFYTAGGPVHLTVYNVLGQPVRRLVHRDLPAGYHQRIWDGTNDSGIAVSSGVYLIYLKDGEATLIQRVALLR